MPGERADLLRDRVPEGVVAVERIAGREHQNAHPATAPQRRDAVKLTCLDRGPINAALSVEPPLPARSWRDRLLIPLRIANVLLARDRAAWRHLRPWLSSLRPGVDPLRLGIPWLTFGAIGWLEEHLRPSWRVLEVGSGGSTRYFRLRVRELLSVEHDPRWAERVRAEVPAGDGFSYRLIPESGLADLLASCPKGHYDLVLIDGGADRVAAALAAVDLIADGGALMLDNSDGLLPRLEALAPFVRSDFFGVAPWNLHRGRVHLHTTSVWRIARY